MYIILFFSANEDYLPQEDVPITFQPGEKVKEFGVAILNDSLAEGDEGFTATLISQDKRVKIALPVAVLGIWRSDGGTNYKWYEAIFKPKHFNG